MRYASAAPTVRVAALPSDALSVADLGELGLNAVLNGAATPEQVATLREEFARSNERLLERTASEARAGARIIFWAEGNAPVLAADAADLIARGQALAQQEQIYLGMALAVFTPEATQPLENQVILVQPDGTLGFTYLKAFPVPGVEALASVRGPAEMPTLDTPYGRIAAVICFGRRCVRSRAGAQQRLADKQRRARGPCADAAHAHALQPHRR